MTIYFNNDFEKDYQLGSKQFVFCLKRQKYNWITTNLAVQLTRSKSINVDT